MKIRNSWRSRNKQWDKFAIRCRLGAVDLFTLEADILSVSDHSSTVQLLFEGEFNAMMAMMIKGPIGKFIETLALNMPKL